MALTEYTAGGLGAQKAGTRMRSSEGLGDLFLEFGGAGLERFVDKALSSAPRRLMAAPAADSCGSAVHWRSQTACGQRRRSSGELLIDAGAL